MNTKHTNTPVRTTSSVIYLFLLSLLFISLSHFYLISLFLSTVVGGLVGRVKGGGKEIDRRGNIMRLKNLYGIKLGGGLELLDLV